MVVSLRSAREARSTLFPIVREEETLRSGRARVGAFLLVALAALFLGGWLATLRLAGPDSSNLADVASAQATEPTVVLFAVETLPPPPTAAGPLQTPPSPLEPAAPLPGEPPTFTPVTVVGVTPEPTATPLPPTATPTSTPLPPTATSTATPTPTPAWFRAPSSQPRTPAPPDVRIGPLEFATGVTEDVQAINPGRVFPEGTPSIYAIYSYSGMQNGLDFAAVWYKDGVEILRDESTWQFGLEARSYNFLNMQGEGLYKLELHVNDSVVTTGLFEIR